MTLDAIRLFFTILAILTIGLTFGRYAFPYYPPISPESFDHAGMHCVAYVDD